MNIQFYSITTHEGTTWYMHRPFYTKDPKKLALTKKLGKLVEFLGGNNKSTTLRFLDESYETDDLILERKKRNKTNEFSFLLNGECFETELPEAMNELDIASWKNIYVSFNDFSEQFNEIEPAYFAAMKHFNYSEAIAQYEWQTLTSTGKWIWWNILAFWSDYATEHNIKWCLGDSKSMTVACLRTFSQGVSTTWPDPMIELFWNDLLPETEGLNLVVFSEEDLEIAEEWTEEVCQSFLPFLRWRLISEIKPVVPKTLHLFKDDVFIWFKKKVGIRFNETGVWADLITRGEKQYVRELLSDWEILDTIPYELYEEVIPDLICKSEIVWNNYIEYYKNK